MAILAAVVVFIIVRKKDAPADDPARAEALDKVAAMVALRIDASAPRVTSNVTRVVPETVRPRRLKNFRNLSIAAASSRLATLSEQPTRAAAARWLFFWKYRNNTNSRCLSDKVSIASSRNGSTARQRVSCSVFIRDSM